MLSKGCRGSSSWVIIINYHNSTNNSNMKSTILFLFYKWYIFIQSIFCLSFYIDLDMFYINIIRSYVLILFSVGTIMIRNNSHLQRKQHKNQEAVLINYRNALYQGQFDEQKQQRQGRGIIYQSNTHHFIACNNFSSNKIGQEALFFHSHSRYHYGRWKENRPHGLCIFRLNQILIITEYKDGKITQGTNILFIFEKYCMGIIVQIEDSNQWSIRSKSQALLHQHIQNLIKECDFKDQEMVSPSIVKFLNRQFPSNMPNSFKLRLINNQYYRYGFDEGLAIFFDDQNRILSVGFHSKNDLVGQIGIRYSPKQNGGLIQEGIFDGVQTFSFQKSKKPHFKLGQMYTKHHLSSINFKNEFFVDPSQQYFSYFQKMMEQSNFKDMINQLVSQSALQSQVMADESLDRELNQRYKKLQFDSLQVPNFKKGYLESMKSQKMKQLFQEQSSIKLADKFQDKNIYLFQTSSFDKLSQKQRLQIMKRQLHNSLSSKEIQPKLPTEGSKKSQKSQQKMSKRNSIKKSSQSRRSDNFSEEFFHEKRIQRPKLPNLEQKIDIIIREPPPQDNNPSMHMHSASRRKNKIFDPSKSVKKDYSPEPKASPFKSRMKSRIFDVSIERSQSRSHSKSPGKSRSAKKIFANFDKSRRQSRIPIRLKPSQQYLSPHMQLGLSVQKSSGSSQIANFPVSMTKQLKHPTNPKESEGIEDEGSINMNVIKKSQSKFSLKQNFKIKEEEISPYRKGNQIYRKPMINGGYNEYIYEPINIKQTGNTPYIKNSSLKSLSKNKSATQLLQNNNLNLTSGKKIIEETSPFKKSKMGGYLNQEREQKLDHKYSDYKKRTGYF